MQKISNRIFGYQQLAEKKIIENITATIQHKVLSPALYKNSPYAMYVVTGISLQTFQTSSYIAVSTCFKISFFQGSFLRNTCFFNKNDKFLNLNMIIKNRAQLKCFLA